MDSSFWRARTMLIDYHYIFTDQIWFDGGVSWNHSFGFSEAKRHHERIVAAVSSHAIA